MKKICTILVLVLMLGLYSESAFALIQAWRLGSVGQDSINNVKSMSANPTTNAHYMTLEFPVGTDFQVTAGFTLYITKIFVTSSGGTNQGVSIGYGDDGVASGVAAPTNFIQLTNAFNGSATNVTTEFDVFISIPAGKYPCVLANAGATFDNFYGIEVAD